MEKECSRCKQLKAIEEFTPDRRQRVGRQPHCRSCDNASKKAWYHSLSAREKKKHIAIVCSRVKSYRERKLAKGICMYCTEPVVAGLKMCRIHLNGHKASQKRRAERAKQQGLCMTCHCRPCFLGRACKVCVTKRREARIAIRAEVFAAYGNKCACCGEAEQAFLSVDHVKNNGAEHRRSGGIGLGSSGFYQWLKRQGFPKKEYQLLCMNCNWAKRTTGQCPHKEK